MHPRFLTQRNEAAQAAIEVAAQTLGQRLGLPESLYPIGVTDRDPDVQAMLRREAVAVLLETLAEAVTEAQQDANRVPEASQEIRLPSDLRDRLLAIRGVGEALADVILATLVQALGTGDAPEEPTGEEGTDAGDASVLDPALDEADAGASGQAQPEPGDSPQ